MYLLYLDESGSVDDPNSHYFVMAGVSVFERQTHWAERAMNDIALRFAPNNPNEIEFHATLMRSGREQWRFFEVADRVQATVDVLNVLNNDHNAHKVFAVVIDKRQVPADQIISTAYERIATCFDDYLANLYATSKGKNPQRGIVIFDKSIYEISLQQLSSTFKHQGHATGTLRNFAEVPLFLDSKASRLIQLADVIAYWIYRRYAALDDRGFKIIEPFIYKADKQLHGLIELLSDQALDSLNQISESPYPFPNPTDKKTDLILARRKLELS